MKVLMWSVFGLFVGPIAPSIAVVVIQSGETDQLILSVAWCSLIQGFMLCLICIQKAAEVDL